MSRKYVYSLLAAPILLALIALAVTPASTRATFFTEFEHRTKKMLGIELPSYDELGPSGSEGDGLDVDRSSLGDDDDDDDDDVSPVNETDETEGTEIEAESTDDADPVGEEGDSTDDLSPDDVTTKAS